MKTVATLLLSVGACQTFTQITSSDIASDQGNWGYCGWGDVIACSGPGMAVAVF